MKQIILIMIIFLGFIGSSYANDLIKEADGFFELRGEGYNKETLLASTTNIDKAIGLYKQAAAEYSGIKREEAIAKMLQSYYFKGRYAMPDKDSRKAVYEEAIKIGEESLKEYPESAAKETWIRSKSRPRKSNKEKTESRKRFRMPASTGSSLYNASTFSISRGPHRTVSSICPPKENPCSLSKNTWIGP